MKHIEGKLVVGNGLKLLDNPCTLRDVHGNLIASTTGTNTIDSETQKANAAELAHRWNLYTELVEAATNANRVLKQVVMLGNVNDEIRKMLTIVGSALGAALVASRPSDQSEMEKECRARHDHLDGKVCHAALKAAKGGPK